MSSTGTNVSNTCAPNAGQSDADHPAFDAQSRWPRRLLHIPSMTSLRWTPGNAYGGHIEPKYIALSYTWGRWTLEESCMPQVRPLPIKGVPWSIPRVNPDLHFSVAEFTHLIHEIMKDPLRFYYFYSWKGRNIDNRTVWGSLVKTVLRILENYSRPISEFLWLDIACIDQRRSEITMAEIGRQARIFQHAEQVYVWLSCLPLTHLSSCLLDLQHGLNGLQIEPYMRGNYRQPVSQTKGFVNQALNGIKVLTEDPWFTSLWTLQEAYLCPKAIILSREGKPVSDLGVKLVAPRSQTLGHIFSCANNLIYWSERTQSIRGETEFNDLVNIIHSKGLAALWKNNPMALLGVSQSRTTLHELDRVYGIMQVFGTDFQVGNTRQHVDQNYVYSLTELSDELGAAVLEKYPVLSQMHVYLTMPPLGKGWCVQSSSTVPEIFERGDLFGWKEGATNRLDIEYDVRSHTLCRLKTRKVAGTLWAHVSGKACEFSLLQNEWKRADQSIFAETKVKSEWRMHRASRPSIMQFALDRGYRYEDHSTQQRVPAPDAVTIEEREHELAAWVAKQFHQLSLKVLLLGYCDFAGEAFNSGLILFEREEQGIRHWHRIGVCMWLTSHLSKEGQEYSGKALLSGQSEDWHNIEGLFG